MPDQIPDIYSDLFSINANAVGVTLILSKTHLPLNAGDKAGAEAVAVLRFSSENIKLILMTARRHMKEVEAKKGKPIHLSEEVLKSLNLTEADW